VENGSVVNIAIECLLAGTSDRDPEEWHHCRRVEKMCGMVAKELGWQPDDVADLKLAALLHHMDRSHVPESALAARVAAFLHHFAERTRRPEEPAGRSRSRDAQGADIIAVADTFDRLVSGQRYRAPLSEAEAIKILHSDAATVFEEATVEAFCRVHADGLNLSEGKAA